MNPCKTCASKCEAFDPTDPSACPSYTDRVDPDKERRAHEIAKANGITAEPLAPVSPALALAEKVGLIGPASRQDDLYPAIERFYGAATTAPLPDCGDAGHDEGRCGNAQCCRPKPFGLSNSDIRKVFLANGFKIKPGCDDLKPYVYQAARALLSAAMKGMPE